MGIIFHPDLLAHPDAARGLKLGATLHWLLVNANRRRKDMRAIEELKAIGFPVEADWEQYVWEHQRLPALRLYQELYGDLVVPCTFVVPTGNKRWPIETWGFKLGTYATNMKSRDHRFLPRKHLEDLDQLNASWHLKELTPAQRLGLLVPTLNQSPSRNSQHELAGRSQGKNSLHFGSRSRSGYSKQAYI
jgi:hypothetical protein